MHYCHFVSRKSFEESTATVTSNMNEELGVYYGYRNPPPQATLRLMDLTNGKARSSETRSLIGRIHQP